MDDKVSLKADFAENGTSRGGKDPDGPPDYAEAISEAQPAAYTASPTIFDIIEKPLGEKTGEARYITISPRTSSSTVGPYAYFAHFPQSREMVMSVHRGGDGSGVATGTCTFRTDQPIGVDVEYVEGDRQLLRLDDLKQKRAATHGENSVATLKLDVGTLVPGIESHMFWQLRPQAKHYGALASKLRGNAKALMAVDLVLVDDRDHRYATFVNLYAKNEKPSGSSKTGEDRKEDWGYLELVDTRVMGEQARDRVVVSLLAAVEMHRRIVMRHTSWTRAIGEGSGVLLGVVLLGACTVM